jgi:sphingomyelin phosphodiesterase acid-like 3
VQYVTAQLRLGLKGIPVYVALGNNDSGCGDYQRDSNDGFLEATKEAMVEGAPSAERTAALASYAAGGDYSLMMQAPMERTRLIVLDDLLQSARHKGCGGEPNPTAVKAQMAWFEKQLAEARLKKEKVWVMAHIPPGVDPYSTFSKMKNVCGGDSPTMFLSSERLAEVMGEYADVIRLGVFGHTHMDEMRLFGKVAIKMVSSISPVDGNDPSFTVAKIDPVNAQLVDYEVIKTSTWSGVDAKWVKEYTFRETYHEPVFSAASLEKLMKEFRADVDVQNDMSEAYLANYGVGTTSKGVKAMALRALWPGYTCAQTNDTEKGFAACVCAGPK